MPLGHSFQGPVFASKGGKKLKATLAKAIALADRILDDPTLCLEVFRPLVAPFLREGQVMTDAQLIALVRSVSVVFDFDTDSDADMQCDTMTNVISINRNIINDAIAMESLDEDAMKQAIYFLAVKLLHELAHLLTLLLQRFSGVEVVEYEPENPCHNTPVGLSTIYCPPRRAYFGDLGFHLEKHLVGGRILLGKDRTFAEPLEKLVVEESGAYTVFSIPMSAIQTLYDAWTDHNSDLIGALEEFKHIEFERIRSKGSPKSPKGAKRSKMSPSKTYSEPSDDEIDDSESEDEAPGYILSRKHFDLARRGNIKW